MLVNVTFENQRVQQLIERAQELMRELDSITMQLHGAMSMEVKENADSGN